MKKMSGSLERAYRAVNGSAFVQDYDQLTVHKIAKALARVEGYLSNYDMVEWALDISCQNTVIDCIVDHFSQREELRDRLVRRLKAA